MKMIKQHKFCYFKILILHFLRFHSLGLHHPVCTTSLLTYCKVFNYYIIVRVKLLLTKVIYILVTLLNLFPLNSNCIYT